MSFLILILRSYSLRSLFMLSWVIMFYLLTANISRTLSALIYLGNRSLAIVLPIYTYFYMYSGYRYPTISVSSALEIY